MTTFSPILLSAAITANVNHSEADHWTHFHEEGGEHISNKVANPESTGYNWKTVEM